MHDDDQTSPGSTKKTRLDSIEKTKLDRRLVEYFVVVSSKEIKKDSASALRKQKQVEWQDDNEFGVSFRPVITARYPLHDHGDNPLHENVTFFCHPSGGIQLRLNEELPKVRIVSPFFSFCETLHSPLTLVLTHLSRCITLLRPEAPAGKSTALA
jgi:hypothetical protein